MPRGNQHGDREYDDLQSWLDMTLHENLYCRVFRYGNIYYFILLKEALQAHCKQYCPTMTKGSNGQFLVFELWERNIISSNFNQI